MDARPPLGLPQMLDSLELFTVTSLRAVAPHFPPAEKAGDVQAVLSFLLWSSPLPTTVLVAGLVFTLFVLSSSLRCCPGRRIPRGKRVYPIYCMALLIPAVALLGTSVWLRAGQRASDAIGVQVVSLIGELEDAVSAGRAALSAGQNISASVLTLVSVCDASGHDRADIMDVGLQMKESLENLGHGLDILSPLAAVSLALRQHVSSIYAMTVLVPAVPCFWLVVCALVAAGAVTISRSGRCSGCCHRSFALCFLAPTVVLVSLLCALQLGLGIVGSSFCADADEGTIFVARSAASLLGIGRRSRAAGRVDLGRVAEFYITGEGSNPLLGAIMGARDSFLHTRELYDNSADLIRQRCPAWAGNEDVRQSFTNGLGGLDTLQLLLSRNRLYPYYDGLVREFVCGPVLFGLGWLSVFQLVLGWLFLPATACLANNYLMDRIVQKRQKLVADTECVEMQERVRSHQQVLEQEPAQEVNIGCPGSSSPCPTVERTSPQTPDWPKSCELGGGGSTSSLSFSNTDGLLGSTW